MWALKHPGSSLEFWVKASRSWQFHAGMMRQALKDKESVQTNKRIDIAMKESRDVTLVIHLINSKAFNDASYQTTTLQGTYSKSQRKPYGPFVSHIGGILR